MSTKERIKKFSKKTLDKCLPFLKLKEFIENIDNVDLDNAKDYLTYGISAIKLEKTNKYDIVIYSSEYNNTDLLFLSKFPVIKEILDLKMLIDISFHFRENKYISKKINIFSCFGSSPKNNNSTISLNRKNKNKKLSLFSFDKNNNNNNSNFQKNNSSPNDNNSNKGLYAYNYNYNNNHNPQLHLSFISLIKSMGEKIDLLFENEEHLKIFVCSIFSIYQAYQIEEEEKPNLNVFEKYLKRIWNKFESKNTECLDLIGFSRMIKLLDQNYNCISIKIKDEKSIKNLFEKLEKEKLGNIYFEDFYNFYNEIFAGQEFEDVFLKYSKGKLYLNFEDLSEFIIKEQKQFMKSDEISNIFLEYKLNISETPRNSESKTQPKKFDSSDKKYYQDRNDLSLDKDIESDNLNNKLKNIEYKMNLMEFKNYICDKSRCNVIDFEIFDIAHDMTKPLNNYFIFSSDNTFLKKNIYGEGSLDMFDYALNEGCRMLELECHVKKK